MREAMWVVLALYVVAFYRALWLLWYRAATHLGRGLLWALAAAVAVACYMAGALLP